MRSNLVALGVLFALPALGAALACCSQLPTCVDANNCTAYQDAGDGSSDALPDVVVPPGCDLAKSPKESPACVSDDVGVFVSPQGKDGATGKKTDPLRSIAEAVGKGKPRVYVCEGTYDANVAITSPVAIYGGLTCLWDASDASRPKLAPPKGIAFRVTKVTGAVDVEDVDIVGSADANTPGDSAIAVFVSDSTNVTIRNVTLAAGPGTAGAKGASRSNYAGATATSGGTSSGATSGKGPTCTCSDATTSKGGNGAEGNGANVAFGSSVPAVGGDNSGGSKATSCDNGTDGANGVANASGAGATSAGSLSVDGWSTMTAVKNAPNGNPAQGGGGGGAPTQGGTNAGGGGGCGGCGGAGGSSAQSGGSSFGLLAFNATVTVTGGSLTTATGGAGGMGGSGQDGQAGGGGGTGGVCKGGTGGNGAGGSGGGGGAGGHSVPVAFVGTEPKVTNATVTPGAKGGSGPGGNAGGGLGIAGAAGTPGLEGKAQNTTAL